MHLYDVALDGHRLYFWVSSWSNLHLHTMEEECGSQVCALPQKSWCRKAVIHADHSFFIRITCSVIQHDVERDGAFIFTLPKRQIKPKPKTTVVILKSTARTSAVLN